MYATSVQFIRFALGHRISRSLAYRVHLNVQDNQTDKSKLYFNSNSLEVEGVQLCAAGVEEVFARLFPLAPKCRGLN